MLRTESQETNRCKKRFNQKKKKTQPQTHLKIAPRPSAIYILTGSPASPHVMNAYISNGWESKPSKGLNEERYNYRFWTSVNIDSQF